MKKLLVLALVLGMASMANAALLPTDATNTNGLVLAVDGTSVTVSGTVTQDFMILVMSDSALSPLDETALTSNAPTLSGFFASLDDLKASTEVDLSSYNSGAIWLIGGAPGEIYKTGDYMTFTVDTGNAVTLAQLNDDMTISQVQTIVPEPMTLALLGLGGLFLRRRK